MLNEKAITPVLAPPGAGIPWPQKIMLRFFIKPFVAAKTPWFVSEQRFHKMNQKIFTEIEGLSNEQLSQKILVPPQRGLEDSSRFWSIKMVLEHLVIVTSEMAWLIPALSKGVKPTGKADIAAVKPLGEISAEEALEKFKKLVSTDFENLNSSIVNKKSKTRFAHPWFGPMTAQEWYWLMSVHHGLHLQQIREIKKGGGVLR